MAIKYRVNAFAELVPEAQRVVCVKCGREFDTLDPALATCARCLFEQGWEGYQEFEAVRRKRKKK